MLSVQGEITKVKKRTGRLERFLDEFKEENRKGFREIRENQKIAQEEMKEIRESQKIAQEEMKELRESQKKTEAMQRKTDEQLNITNNEIRELRESQKKTEEMQKRTDREIKNLLDKTREFSDNWGKLSEEFFRPALIKLLKDRGINVEYIHPRFELEFIDHSTVEVDMFCYNGDSVVLIEAKTNLKQQHIDYHINKRLKRIKLVSIYKSKKIYGGVCGIHITKEVKDYAIKKGLFVFSLTGKDIIRMENNNEFSPIDYSNSSQGKNTFP